MVVRVRTWRVAFYICTAIFVLSLALSDPGGVGAKTLAYIGVGGMIASVLGMGMVVTRCAGSRDA